MTQYRHVPDRRDLTGKRQKIQRRVAFGLWCTIETVDGLDDADRHVSYWRQSNSNTIETQA